MKTVYVHFSNHFDLVWRRCWERDYVYQGRQYASYRRVEELCLLRNLALAEAGEGAYVVEQALSLRAFLKKHPAALPRLQALYRKGLFEMCGAGEAIIDINLCSFETMCRNLASGVRYCRDVLGMPPLLANHGDGFGSSAQFPQVIRQCGLPGINGLSYSQPDNLYWRGLDGSTILVWKGAPGHGYFYDHCYHEPCRACLGTGVAGDATCAACDGTGFDMPQNFYPPFAPVPADKLSGDVASYNVCSEEMLPPEGFSAHLRRWEQEQPDVRYLWGTPRHFQGLWTGLAAAVDAAPAAKVASRVENNPVQTGCYVSRIRIKQLARQAEETLYGWETALALSAPAALNTQAWAARFQELPLYFFHDAITGTHQDEAYAELLTRMAATVQDVTRLGQASLAVPPGAGPTGPECAVFAPVLAPTPLRIPLPAVPWHDSAPLTAVTPQGTRFPVVCNWHAAGPAVPLPTGRMIVPVGPTARTRPPETPRFIETDGLTPLTWTRLRLEPAQAPQPLTTRELRNPHLSVALGDHGVAAVRDLATDATAKADAFQLGELLLEEDEGDPWGTRKLPAFQHGLAPFTTFLGALQFEGYQEAYYSGVYEPNLRFGREADPAIFALEWYVTVRLLAAARRVDFTFEVFWKTANRRLRAVFPTAAAQDNAWYSIPGGWLERARYEQTETALWSPNGDWPALHFAAAQAPAGATGWAVVNYGTPSCRVEAGRIQVSLLRSPGFGHCLERYGQEYPMPTSGIRDPGWHHFTLSLVPHAGVADMPRLALDASALNKRPAALPMPATTAMPPEVPFRIEGDGIELVAAKLPLGTELPAGTRVLRLLNLRPAANVARLRRTGGNGGGAVAATFLTEDHAVPLTAAPDGTWPLTFRAFEVKTICLEPS